MEDAKTISDPPMPQNCRLFEKDWQWKIVFLVDVSIEYDYERKVRREFKLLSELDEIQAENARCVARCAWMDSKNPNFGEYRVALSNADIWRAWRTK